MSLDFVPLERVQIGRSHRPFREHRYLPLDPAFEVSSTDRAALISGIGEAATVGEQRTAIQHATLAIAISLRQLRASNPYGATFKSTPFFAAFFTFNRDALPVSSVEDYRGIPNCCPALSTRPTDLPVLTQLNITDENEGTAIKAIYDDPVYILKQKEFAILSLRKPSTHLSHAYDGATAPLEDSAQELGKLTAEKLTKIHSQMTPGVGVFSDFVIRG